MDLVVATFPQEPLVHAESQLDVLAREALRVAADLLEDVAPPDLERSDRAQHEAQSRPREAVVEERPQVLEVLICHERPVTSGPPDRKFGARVRRSNVNGRDH
jgi:hypothetical protein